MRPFTETLHSPAFEKALEAIGKSVVFDGGLLPSEMTAEDLNLLYELGFGLYETGEYPSATEVFRRLVIGAPFEPKHWRGLGSSLQMMKKYEEALLPWSMWCLIESDNPLPHFHAAESLFSLGNKEEGAKALQAAQSRDKEGKLERKISALKLAWNLS